MHHVGFTLISLLDGFVIVLAIDLGAPLPVVLLLAAAAIAGGIAAVGRLAARVA